MSDDPLEMFWEVIAYVEGGHRHELIQETVFQLAAALRVSRERVARLQNTVVENIEEIKTLKARVKALEKDLAYYKTHYEECHEDLVSWMRKGEEWRDQLEAAHRELENLTTK